MSKVIDAIGKVCPMPVVMTKKEIEQGTVSIITLVDNETAVENLKRLADSTGFLTQVTKEQDGYRVSFSKEGDFGDEVQTSTDKVIDHLPLDYVIFIGKETIGEGDNELGKNLMRMFLYTLSEMKEYPSHILFMNGGVKLPTLDEQAVKSLLTLKDKGVKILVCGACLNFYGLTDELKIGTVSNMYEITDKMRQAGKVINF